MLSPEAQRQRTGSGGEQAVAQELENLLRHVNGELEDHEKLDYLVVVNEAWTVENGFLTPTLKIKRDVIEERYLPQSEYWSGLGRTVIWH